MKALFTLLLVFISHLSLAEQPRLSEVTEAFRNAPEVVKIATQLTSSGYAQQDTAGAVIHGAINDEGLDGTYFVSIYFEKGDQPWNRTAKMITGVVTMNAGFVRAIKVIDGAAAETALLGLK